MTAAVCQNLLGSRNRSNNYVYISTLPVRLSASRDIPRTRNQYFAQEKAIRAPGNEADIFRYCSVSDAARTFSELFLNFRIQTLSC